jgi:hypothetical protein
MAPKKKLSSKPAQAAPNPGESEQRAEFLAIIKRLSECSRRSVLNLARAMADDKTYLTAAKRRQIVKLVRENRHAEVAALCDDKFQRFIADVTGASNG